MRRATLIALCVSGLVLLFAAAVAGNYLLTDYQIGHAQKQWCDTFTLLTGAPVPVPANPAANPSRVQAYRLYEDFITLRARFGCRS